MKTSSGQPTVKKKQAISPPQKITYKDSYSSPRNAPQEIIASDTSIGNQLEEEMQQRQGNKFYSPQYRAEVANSWKKSKSPQQKTSRPLTQRAPESKTMTNAQKQALAEIEKAKQNKMLKSTTERVRIPSNQDQSRKNSGGYQRTGNALNIKPITEPIEEEQWQSSQKIIDEPQVFAGQTFSPVKRNENAAKTNMFYTFPNGDRYNGEWNGKWIEGRGIYDFTKQNLQYRGDFKGSKQHGRGVLLRTPAGSQQRQDVIYDGQWMNGYKQGFGTYYYFKDTYYEGNWIKNTKEGQGKFKSPEGQYNGEWRNDKKHGKGVLQLSNGTILDGQFNNDKFQRGKIIYSNGDQYQGDCQNNSRHGYGTYNYANNRTNYQGRWQGNSKSGGAVISYSNGDRYEGGMLNNRRDGPICKYEWRETGDEVIGEFVGDLPTRGKILIKGQGQFEFDLAK